MLENGYSTWLFDGLDELYAGDKHFFGYILDLLTRPDTQAQILICARDSLLTTNEEFAQFIEEFGDDSPIELYRLSDWENPSKRALAWLRLEERTPRNNENDTKDVSSFLNKISRNPALHEISRIPYYCDLLLDAFKNNSLQEFDDEFSLLGHAVKKILEREAQKGLLFEDSFESGDLEEWLEVTATEAYLANYKGLSSENIKEYAEMVIKTDLSEEEKTQAIMTLVQFPIFSDGMSPGTVNFKHELIAEYLAAKYLFRVLKSNKPNRIANYIGDRLDFAESLIHRSLSKEIASNENVQAKIVKALETQNMPGRAFAHLLQILITASPNTRILEDNPSFLESRDLRGVLFKDIALDNVSFRNSNLTEAKFVSCSLPNTQFEGALLSETHFDELNEDSLYNSNFGNLERCQSVMIDGKRFSERNDLWNWVQKNTSTQAPQKDPCPAAMQLNVLFLKYVRLDGSGRRDELQEAALLRGRRHPGAPRPEMCVNACRRHGYLEGPDQRQRLRRAQNEKYTEIVKYVRNWQLSPGIREMLDSLCSRGNCPHIPF